MARVHPVDGTLRQGNALLKIQSVEVFPIEVANSSQAESIGQVIDRQLRAIQRAGRHPSKLVLDLNPPADNPLDMGDKALGDQDE